MDYRHQLQWVEKWFGGDSRPCPRAMVSVGSEPSGADGRAIERRETAGVGVGANGAHVGPAQRIGASGPFDDVYVGELIPAGGARLWRLPPARNAPLT